MQNPNSLHKEGFEFALLNPQFRDLPTHEIKRKLSAIVNSSEASKYALSIWSAVVDHGGIDNISAVADQLLNTTIKNIIISHEGSKSGAPVVCKNLAQSLAQNDTVILISFGTNYIFSNLEGVIVINFSSPLSRSGYWGFLLGKWLTELGCIDNATGIIGSTLETSEFIKQEHIRYSNDDPDRKKVTMSDYCLHWKLGKHEFGRHVYSFPFLFF